MLTGSNWGIFAPDNADGSINGLIPRYHLNPTAVAQQFQQARTNGQTSASLGIWYYNGANDGFAVNSAGGGLDVQSLSNFRNIVALIKSLGFSELFLRFAPEGANDSSNWTAWNENGPGGFQESWNFIIQAVLAAEAAAPGLALRLDLWIEGVPRPNTAPFRVQWLQKLWANINIPSFWNQMPKTVSFIPEIGILQQIPAIFSSKPLDFLAPDIYGPSVGDDTTPYPSFYDGFMPLINGIKGTNHASLPWYVTESFMNDWDNAMWCSRVIKDTGIKILGLNQWPVTRASEQRAKQGLLKDSNFDGQPVDATAYVQTLGAI